MHEHHIHDGFSLAGKVILVTGAGSGMGREFARHAAGQGASLALCDSHGPAGQATLAEMVGRGGRGIFVEADVSDDAGVAMLVDLAMEAFGRIDAAFNNAGIAGARAPVTELAVEDWRRAVDVNLTGTFLCMRHQLRVMKRQGHGVIVNNSSIGARRGHKSWAGVCASKAGIEALTRVAAMENVQHGIRVNAVAPGLIDTPANRRVMTEAELSRRVELEIPMRRLGRSSEVAHAVQWLMSDGASYVTGHVLAVDGGLLA